jgi:hypothetical protein
VYWSNLLWRVPFVGYCIQSWNLCTESRWSTLHTYKLRLIFHVKATIFCCLGEFHKEFGQIFFLLDFQIWNLILNVSLVFLFFSGLNHLSLLFLPMEKSKLTENKKGQTDEEKSLEHAHHFLWHQGDCSHRIFPGRPVIQFCILLWRLREYVTLLWTLAIKELAVVLRQRTVSQFLFHWEFFDQKRYFYPPPTLLPWLSHLRLFCCPDWR